jgi:N-terminal domain of cytochrome oxidase-cbb3, FixP
MAEDMDKLEDFERHETKNKLPLGWLVLYVGLIVWGLYYSVAFTPQIGGWSQEGQYHESLKQK